MDEKRYPAVYRLSRVPGGMGLRMAMVHDVLHERYWRHGAAWYEERNRIARGVIEEERAKGTPASERSLAAMDDLGVGLELQGKSMEAAEVMREKLRVMPALGREVKVGVVEEDDAAAVKRIVAAKGLPALDKAHYSAHANLGTFLIHAEAPKAMGADVEEATKGKALMREGLEHIERSIAINPAAHFGRENWQALVVRHFLVGLEDRTFLETYDMVGGLLEERRSSSRGRGTAALKEEEAGMSVERRTAKRRDLPRYGARGDWAERVEGQYRTAHAFDEPLMGLMGMWTLGGGANPHSAMTIGHIMESVRERRIAWNAYQRAMDLKEKWMPAESRHVWVKNCEERQKTLGKALAKEDGVEFAAWDAAARQAHRDELEWGKGMQRAYQEFEAKQIAAGVRLDDPHFYDAFFTGREEIASPVGEADEVVVRVKRPNGWWDSLPVVILGGGLGMMLGALTTKRRKVGGV